MDPCVWVMSGGGGAGGGSGGSGKGSRRNQGANGGGRGDNAAADGKGACGVSPGSAAQGCPNHHGSNSGTVAGGDPVDLVTGRVFEGPLTDVEIRGRLGLVFTRSYTSTDVERDVGLGYGWCHNFSWTVRETGRKTTIHNDVGMPLEFGAVMREGDVGLGPRGCLLLRTAQGYVLDEPQGRQLVFTKRVADRWVLTAVVDGYGNTTTLRYDDRHLLTEVEDPAGRVLRLERLPSGRISAASLMTAPTQGRSVKVYRYDYDEEGHLTRTVDASGCITHYEYEKRRLVRKTDPEGFTFHYRYDLQGRCIETWGTHEDDTRLGLSATAPAVLADGTRAKGMFHCRLMFFEDGGVEVANAAGLRVLEGNKHGKCDRATVGGNVYARSFDERGNLLSFTDPAGHTTTWERDEHGWPLQITDPLGRTTRFDREADGHLRAVVYPDAATVLVERGPGWLAWRDQVGADFAVRLDDRGSIIETHAPNGAVTRLDYDTCGNLVRKTNAQGQSVAWSYDYWGRLTSFTDANGHTEQYAYNDRGDRISRTTPTGRTYRYRHDGNRALRTVIYPSGVRQQIEVGIGGKLLNVTRPNGDRRWLRYDRDGRLVEGSNARGERYAFKWDSGGRIIEEKTFTGLVKSYDYDETGLLLQESWNTGEVVTFEYDAVGQVQTRTLNDEEQERFEYDWSGRLVRAEGRGGVFEYRYNALGWLVEEVHTLGDETVSIRTEHDLMGNPVRRETSWGHSVSCQYDACGRALRYVLDEDQVIERTYDATGREIERRLPRGAAFITKYDAEGRIVDQMVTGLQGPRSDVPTWEWMRPANATLYQSFVYGEDGWLEQIVDHANRRQTFTHDAAGWVTGRIRSDGPSEHFYYDELGNLYPHSDPDAPILWRGRVYGPGNLLEQDGDRTFEWDRAGRLLAVKERDAVTRFRWDALGRLSAVEQPDGRELSFTYDAFARRVEKRVSVPSPQGTREETVHRYVWCGGALMRESNVKWGENGHSPLEQRTYLFDDTRLQPLAQRLNDGDWYHFVNDEVGAPEYLVDSGGQVANTFRRTAFGLVETEGGGLPPSITHEPRQPHSSRRR